MPLLTENSYFASFSVKAMLLIIDCKKKLTWKKRDHVKGAVISVDGKVASEEKELLKAAESGEVTDKVMEDGVDDLLVSIDKIMAFVTLMPTHFMASVSQMVCCCLWEVWRSGTECTWIWKGRSGFKLWQGHCGGKLNKTFYSSQYLLEPWMHVVPENCQGTIIIRGLLLGSRFRGGGFRWQDFTPIRPLGSFISCLT